MFELQFTVIASSCLQLQFCFVLLRVFLAWLALQAVGNMNNFGFEFSCFIGSTFEAKICGSTRNPYDFVNQEVLTMKWVEGDRPVDMLLFADLANPDGNAQLRKQQMKAKQRLFSMVNKGVEASLVQLFDSGLLHADPHPGNILYTVEGKMVFLDFGLICRMKREHQLAMMASVTHIVNADWDSFVLDLAAMDVLPSYVNRGEIAQATQSLGEAVHQEGIPDIKFSKVGKISTWH
ncbi:hypothetical protein L7F22_040888 [Adiantum nelumboides]|nr:hypothetical protein [Adiantum nelumboides]